MIIEKFSGKAQELIEAACRLAVKKDHKFVTSRHFLSILVAHKTGVFHTTLQSYVKIVETRHHLKNGANAEKPYE